MTKEEIEKAAESYLMDNNHHPFSKIRDAFKAGAEWAYKNIDVKLLGNLHEVESENERLKAEMEWISVEDRLPENYKLGMSKDVLTIAGSKMSVKSYDYELKRWNGSPHITVTHWQPLPSPPKQ